MDQSGERKARVNLRALKAMAPFVCVDEMRYYMRGVHVELEPKSTLLVATDGHVLMAHRDDVFADDAVNTLLGSFTVPLDICKAHRIGGKDDLALGDLCQSEAGGDLTLRYGDVGISFKTVDGEFPNWRKVVPREKPSLLSGQFNPELLAKFGKFGKAMGIRLPAIAHNGDGSPARVTFPASPYLLGVVMPFRSERPAPLAPDWIDKPLREAAE